MKKTRNAKRALVLSAIALLMCISMLVGSTFAWFTDSVTSARNQIVSGNLDVELYYSTWDAENNTWSAYAEVDANTKIFSDEALYEPGYTEVVRFQVKNAGSLALKYNMTAMVYSEDAGINVNNELFNLSDYIFTGKIDDINAIVDRDSAAAYATSKLGTGLDMADSNSLVPGAVNEFAIVLNMPTTVGNEANHLEGYQPSIEFGIALVATQLTYEEDSFNDQYDKDSEYPAVLTEVGTADELIEAIANGGAVVMTNDITLPSTLVITKTTVLDGNGYTLTYTGSGSSARAINVNGANGVTIKDLTIEAGAAERAINIIQNATNVTIDEVTATAANYTVNVASSAPNAVVTIKDSTLTGLCTVNVTAEGATVAVNNSTVNCVDNNTTVGESYAALSLNADAVAGKIIATGSTINVTAGSDSYKGRNAAEDGVVTINGSDDEVLVIVAAITYGTSPYYHTFASVASAVEFAKNGDTIILIRDITENLTVVQKENTKITIDGNGHTFYGSITVDGKSATIATAGLTIKNVNFDASAITTDACINMGDNANVNNTRYVANLTVENCTFTGTYPAAEKVGIKTYTGGGINLLVKDCTATNMHSLAQVHNIVNVEFVGCDVVDCKNGISVGSSRNAKITDCTIDADAYGIRCNGEEVDSALVITDCDITANIPVVIRKVAKGYALTVDGTNTMNATNGDGLWCVAATNEYGDVDKAGLTAVKVTPVITVNDAALDQAGIYVAQ